MSKQRAKTIHFMRHGRSIDNISPVFQGVMSPLSPEGEKQTQLIADRLKRVEFDALVASPVSAKQTAEAIAATTVMEYRDAFEEDYAWRLWTYNDHAHFAE